MIEQIEKLSIESQILKLATNKRYKDIKSLPQSFEEDGLLVELVQDGPRINLFKASNVSKRPVLIETRYNNYDVLLFVEEGFIYNTHNSDFVRAREVVYINSNALSGYYISEEAIFYIIFSPPIEIAK